MFEGLNLLTTLDLSKFDTSKVEEIDKIFYGCESLEYINMKNFNQMGGLFDFGNMFYIVPKNVIICVNESNIPQNVLSQIKGLKFYKNDCSNNWKLSQQKILEDGVNCIDNCTNDYKYEYNGKCYKNCPSRIVINNTNECKCNLEQCLLCTTVALINNLCSRCNYNYYKKENDTLNFGEYFNCYKEPKGYYLDKDDLIYKKCYYTCDTCGKKGNNITGVFESR